MAVNDYIRNCQYNLNNLDNYIYLYKFTHIDYITDDGENNGSGKSLEDGFRIYAENVQYSSTSDIDNRFSFENTLTVTLTEGKNEIYYDLIQQLISNDWLVVFKNVEGDYFTMNAEFPAMVSYTYTFNDEKTPNTISIVFKILQNIPTINLRGSVTFSETLREKPCEYNISRIQSLKMVDMDKAVIDVEDDSFNITQKGENSLKTIEFNPTSLSFVDSYDGNEFSQTLSFQIPFDSYRFYFHYNLLEYLDNRYYALIQTTNGNNILSGFKQGLFPSYSISTSDSGNLITINLNAKYTTYSILGSNEFGLTVVPYREYVRLFGECIDNNYTYTLLQELNTDNYYCLNGYEEIYSGYNIVGTYDKFDVNFGVKLTDYSYDCFNACAIHGLPSSIIFSESGESKSFTVTSDCSFTFDYDNSIVDVSYNGTTLTITNKVDEETTYNVNVISENGTTYKILCVVQDNIDADQTLYITAEKQSVTVIPINGITNISNINTDLPYMFNQYGNGIVLNVPMNESTANTINYLIEINYTNNTKETILIIQDKLYEMLLDNGLTDCVGNDLYSMNTRMIGYSDDNITINAGLVPRKSY